MENKINGMIPIGRLTAPFPKTGIKNGEDPLKFLNRILAITSDTSIKGKSPAVLNEIPEWLTHDDDDSVKNKIPDWLIIGGNDDSVKKDE